MSSSANAGGPTDPQSGNPTEISPNSGPARVIAEAIAKDITEIKSGVNDLKNNRRDDFIKLLMIYGAGFVFLAGMIVSSYLLLDNKISSVSDLGIRVDTKLEELIKRIPPVQTPVPTPAPAPQRP